MESKKACIYGLQPKTSDPQEEKKHESLENMYGHNTSQNMIKQGDIQTSCFNCCTMLF